MPKTVLVVTNDKELKNAWKQSKPSKKGKKRLVKLDINGLESRESHETLLSVAKDNKLKEIAVKNVFITGNDLRQFLQALTQNPNAKNFTLDISGNQLNDGCIEMLQKLLEKNALTSLTLPAGLQTEHIHRVLLSMIANKNELQSLVIPNSLLDNESIDSLEILLKKKRIKSQLVLNGCTTPAGSKIHNQRKRLISAGKGKIPTFLSKGIVTWDAATEFQDVNEERKLRSASSEESVRSDRSKESGYETSSMISRTPETPRHGYKPLSRSNSMQHLWMGTPTLTRHDSSGAISKLRKTLSRSSLDLSSRIREIPESTFKMVSKKDIAGFAAYRRASLESATLKDMKSGILEEESDVVEEESESQFVSTESVTEESTKVTPPTAVDNSNAAPLQDEAFVNAELVEVAERLTSFAVDDSNSTTLPDKGVDEFKTFEPSIDVASKSGITREEPPADSQVNPPIAPRNISVADHLQPGRDEVPALENVHGQKDHEYFDASSGEIAHKTAYDGDLSRTNIQDQTAIMMVKSASDATKKDPKGQSEMMQYREKEKTETHISEDEEENETATIDDNELDEDFTSLNNTESKTMELSLKMAVPETDTDDLATQMKKLALNDTSAFASEQPSPVTTNVKISAFPFLQGHPRYLIGTGLLSVFQKSLTPGFADAMRSSDGKIPIQSGRAKVPTKLEETNTDRPSTFYHSEVMKQTSTHDTGTRSSNKVNPNKVQQESRVPRVGKTGVVRRMARQYEQRQSRLMRFRTGIGSASFHWTQNIQSTNVDSAEREQDELESSVDAPPNLDKVSDHGTQSSESKNEHKTASPANRTISVSSHGSNVHSEEATSIVSGDMEPHRASSHSSNKSSSFRESTSSGVKPLINYHEDEIKQRAQSAGSTPIMRYRRNAPGTSHSASADGIEYTKASISGSFSDNGLATDLNRTISFVSVFEDDSLLMNGSYKNLGTSDADEDAILDETKIVVGKIIDDLCDMEKTKIDSVNSGMVEEASLKDGDTLETEPNQDAKRHVDFNHVPEVIPKIEQSEKNTDIFLSEANGVSVFSISFSADIGPEGGEIPVQDCRIKVPPGTFKEKTKIFGKLKIDPSKCPPGHIPITPMLYLKSSNPPHNSVNVKMTSWCINDGSEAGKGLTVDVLHLADGSDEWDTIATLPFEDETKFQFDTPDYSPFVVALKKKLLGPQKFLIDARLFSDRNDNFIFIFHLKSQLISLIMTNVSQYEECNVYDTLTVEVNETIGTHILAENAIFKRNGRKDFVVDERLTRTQKFRRFSTFIENKGVMPDELEIKTRIFHNNGVFQDDCDFQYNLKRGKGGIVSVHNDQRRIQAGNVIVGSQVDIFQDGGGVAPVAPPQQNLNFFDRARLQSTSLAMAICVAFVTLFLHLILHFWNLDAITR